MKLTFAFCTYNRADRLKRLVAAIRTQECPLPFEILAVNNNSQDNTLDVLEQLANEPGPPLRIVTETNQGIVPARNRAITEALNSDILVFIDDDELPLPGFIQATVSALRDQGAECAGGRVRVRFGVGQRPYWLEDNILGFLAEVNYGDKPFWISDDSTPVWTANIAYRTSLFRNGLRFDQRYNREGKGIGGGEDVMMFRRLLEIKAKMLYVPDMIVEHFVEEWRLNRRYFLKVHYTSGYKTAFYELPDYQKTVFGVPPFLINQFLYQSGKAIWMYLTRQIGALRQAMNACHALGMVVATFSRQKKNRIL